MGTFLLNADQFLHHFDVIKKTVGFLDTVGSPSSKAFIRLLDKFELCFTITTLTGYNAQTQFYHVS